MGVGGGQEFWVAVRGNLRRLDEARIWWRVAEGPLQPVIEDRELCHTAAGLLPPEPSGRQATVLFCLAVRSRQIQFNVTKIIEALVVDDCAVTVPIATPPKLVCDFTFRKKFFSARM